jgi:hypothetical protein
MPVLQDHLVFRIPYVFEGQAVGYFAITVLAVVALVTLGCTTLYLIRRLERNKPDDRSDIGSGIKPGLARRIHARRDRALRW